MRLPVNTPFTRLEVLPPTRHPRIDSKKTESLHTKAGRLVRLSLGREILAAADDLGLQKVVLHSTWCGCRVEHWAVAPSDALRHWGRSFPELPFLVVAERMFLPTVCRTVLFMSGVRHLLFHTTGHQDVQSPTWAYMHHLAGENLRRFQYELMFDTDAQVNSQLAPSSSDMADCVYDMMLAPDEFAEEALAKIQQHTEGIYENVEGNYIPTVCGFASLSPVSQEAAFIESGIGLPMNTGDTAEIYAFDQLADWRYVTQDCRTEWLSGVTVHQQLPFTAPAYDQEDPWWVDIRQQVFEQLMQIPIYEGIVVVTLDASQSNAIVQFQHCAQYRDTTMPTHVFVLGMRKWNIVQVEMKVYATREAVVTTTFVGLPEQVRYLDLFWYMFCSHSLINDRWFLTEHPM